MKKLFFLSFCIFITTNLLAQYGRGPSPEMLDEIKSKKIAFITTELQLTSEEAQKFWPVYNEFEKKRFDFHKKLWKFRNMEPADLENKSEAELKEITFEYVDFIESEASLAKEYNDELLKVLSPKKILLLYRTENAFRSHLIKDYRRGRGPDFKDE